MNFVGSLALATVLLSGTVLAAQEGDPDWPCVQRKVEHLSLAVMWPEPVPEDTGPLPDELDDLAEQMALRRVPVEEIGMLVDQLGEEDPGIDGDTYGRVFAVAFDRIDRQRTMIVQGIARYAHGQANLAREIDALRGEFDEMEAAEDPDFDRLDELEAQIDWRERVFNDRSAALTYVCESPVLLEKRAYEVAQVLLQHLD